MIMSNETFWVSAALTAVLASRNYVLIYLPAFVRIRSPDIARQVKGAT